MEIVFEDTDLEELITTGRNGKYKKYTRNAKFMTALATAYNYCDWLIRQATCEPSRSFITNSWLEPMG